MALIGSRDWVSVKPTVEPMMAITVIGGPKTRGSTKISPKKFWRCLAPLLSGLKSRE